ncbi:manganese-dependent ADP-ribose/CDP-alcohol diphosphatase isoform X2 [Scleropages formosus]|uniref:manganese-dependent ADP-ribose/CDP-alcohol diphosphatase isoform X2 n=1 Tax=Scleropages formosus TaxID=113540 RepID=UPI00087902C0|nr:manganese-dependent ADP-ribose/CDP-alcohol diphosphatase isoform X2 [Scleropages formosus]
MFRFKCSFRYNNSVHEGGVLGWRTKRAAPAHRTSSISGMEEEGARPLFSFGVIADIQYADIDDGYNFVCTRRRYYRHSLKLLRRASDSWKSESPRPSFVLQLGDIIDGFNKKHDASRKALDAVLRELNNDGAAAVHHVWGNHEFYNFSREELSASALNSKGVCGAEEGAAGDSYWYDFSPAPRFRFVVLDAYDVSVIGRQERSERYGQALRLLLEHNDNEELNNPPARPGLEQRFVKFNGGFSQDQLQWLDRLLTISDEKHEKVTIVSHLPVHPSSSDPICLAWNYDEVLSVLHSHKCVVCFMAGHDHDGGYHKDFYGIHYLTFEGVIETPPEQDAFGTVYVYEDKMILKGHGRVASRILQYL